LLLNFESGRPTGGSKAVVVEENSQSFSETMNENYLKGSRVIRIGVGERCKTDGCNKKSFTMKVCGRDAGVEGEDGSYVQAEARC
jgi:hypothetical protein